MSALLEVYQWNLLNSFQGRRADNVHDGHQSAAKADAHLVAAAGRILGCFFKARVTGLYTYIIIYFA